MARSNSNGTLKYVGLGVVAIVGGVAIGLLVGGMRASHAPEQIAQQPAPAVSAPVMPSAAPPVVRPHINGDYTAPGAPRITIREESAPTLRRADRTVPTPPADTEASQEATPPVKTKPAKDSSDAAPTDTPTPSDTAPAMPAPAPDAATPSDDSKPPAPPPAPADPDFERVGKPADPESGQEGGKSQSGQDSKAQYRVQTGSYTDESNARSIADQLRGQGYTASTHSERDGDHLVYKVQAGAYRSRSGAAKAAGDLQKKGFPAYVAPITPKPTP